MLEKQAKILNRKVEVKSGRLVVTRTTEAAYTAEEIAERIRVLNVHREKAEAALEKINSEIAELTAVQLQFEKGDKA